jgi:L-alanine-DL-glutamate epimerase-like enolase superfamily enzyme
VASQSLSDLGSIAEASGARIVGVRPVFLSHTYPSEAAPAWSGGWLPGSTLGLVEITTDSGVTGIGETYAGVFAPEVVRAIVEYHADALIGRDPSQIHTLITECRRRMLYWGRTGIAIAALSAVEAALWDVCGKLVGKPVVELLGGARHPSLPRYASGGVETDRQRMRAEATEVREAGFIAMKIRTGVSPSADREKASLMLEALGPGVRLAVDAVQGTNPNPWEASQAIETGRALEDLGLLWYEEPCAAWDIDGYAACRAALDIPIAGGESSTSLEEVALFLDRDAVDILQPDAAWLGGLLPVIEAGEMAQRAGVDVAVHAWGGAGSVMGNYHAAFAMPACRWLEYPTQPNPLITVLMSEPLQVEQGRVLPPTAPGLGLRLTPELEAAYPYQPDHRYHFEERR